MTIEKLLGSSASELEAMSDAELENFFAPYLDVTRPERQTVKKQEQSNFGGPGFNTPNLTKEQRAFITNQLKAIGMDPTKIF